jgi:hypothetical protein
MKPTRDHDHILKSRLVQRQSTRQPAQVQIKMLLQWALGDDTDAGRSLSNPRSLSTYLSNFVVVLWNKIMKMLSLTRSLTHSLSLCIIVGYRQCRQKVTVRRQHFRRLLHTPNHSLPSHLYQTTQIQSSIYSSKYKTHNPKGKEKKNLLIFSEKRKNLSF